MIPVEDAETLLAGAKALRAEVREVVAILENWNADRHRNHAGREVRQTLCQNSDKAIDRQPTRGGGGATPPTGIRPDDGPARGAGADETWNRS